MWGREGQGEELRRGGICWYQRGTAWICEDAGVIMLCVRAYVVQRYTLHRLYIGILYILYVGCNEKSEQNINVLLYSYTKHREET